MRRRQDTGKRVTARRLGPREAALDVLMSRAWSLPPRRNRVTVERDLVVAMSDAAAANLVPTRYEIGLDKAHPSWLLLPAVP